MWKWYDSHIVKIENETPTTKRIWVKVETDEPLTYQAGQFVTMDLPISEKRLKRWRSYSIANAPNALNTDGTYLINTEGSTELEFCVVKAENSTGGSKYLCEEATIGTPIRFKGPDGTFVLKQPLDNHDLVFICTGTGIAPFRSMIWDIYNQQIPHRKIHLIFGARYEKDILYRKELEEFDTLLPNFKFDIALSRETAWQGHKGYVHSIYTEGYREKRPDVDFYICGWSNMIDDAVAKLIVDLGYDKSQIHYELYG
jgi:ferredoxin-NADP reductase